MKISFNNYYLRTVIGIALAKLTVFIPSFIVGSIAYLLTPRRPGYAHPEDEFEVLLWASIYSSRNLFDWLFWLIWGIFIAYIIKSIDLKLRTVVLILFIFISGWFYYKFLNFGFESREWFILHYIFICSYFFLLCFFAVPILIKRLFNN